MANKQETLIYIEQDDKTEAEFMSRSFVKNTVKNRAYINALGSELFIKYLTSEGINASETHNIHSISKILEKFDISDIMLKNIHLDVRVIFDENQIFIPKSHFQYELTPDIYVVLKLAQDFSHVEFLGYFEPKLLNLKLQNNDYYFITKDKLSSPDKIKQFIKDFPGDTSRGISEDNILRGRELFIAMADHNITDAELKELLELLLLSDELRESVLEFDNFETLSYSVGSSFPDHKDLIDTTTLIEGETTNKTEDSSSETDQNSNDENENLEESTSETMEVSDTLDELNTSEVEFNDDLSIIEPNLEPEESVIDDNNDIYDEAINSDSLMTEDNNIIDIQSETEEQNALDQENFTSTEENIDTNDSLFDFDSLSIDEETPLTDELDFTPTQSVEENSNIQTLTPSENTAPETDNNTKKTTGEAISKAVKKGSEIAGSAAAAASSAAAAAAAENIITAGSATKDAMKLAGISGDIVNDLINKNLENQQKHLNKIDYSQISTNATEVPEHIAAYDLSTAKMEADLEAEASGQFDSPKDLSELKTVEVKQTLGEEENFEPETIDLSSMDAVEQENYEENTESIVDMNNLSTIETPTTPIKNLDEKLQQEQIAKDENLSDLDFSNMSSFTINSDGSSPLDDIDINFNNNETEENLIDLGLSSKDFIIEADQTSSTTTDEALEADLMLEDGITDNLNSLEETTTDEALEADLMLEDNILDNSSAVNKTENNNISEDNLDLTTQVSEELTIDENFENNMALDTENISLDDSSAENINISTESTLEELSTTIQEEPLTLDEPTLDTTAIEPLTVSEHTTENTVEITPEVTSSATKDYEEISADSLLDEVINNIDSKESKNEEDTIDLTAIETPEIKDTPETPETIDNSNTTTTIEQVDPIVNSEPQNLENTQQSSELNLPVEDNTEDITISDNLEANSISSTEQADEEIDIIDNIDNITDFENTTSTIEDTEINNLTETPEIDNLPVADSQDWMDDTNYDDLQDIDITQPTVEETTTPQQETLEIQDDEINPDEFITEPDENNEKVYTVTENSTVISDTNFKVGEIPIDINNPETQQLEGPEQLESLYDPNNTVPGAALLQNPGRLGSANKVGGKSGLGLGIIGVIITIIIVGIIGFSVSKMLHKPTEEAPQPITDDTTPTSSDNGVSDANTLNVDQNNVVNMDNNTTVTNPTPALPAAKPVKQKTVQQSQTPQVNSKKKFIPSTTFLEVSKLTWEVPDYISYNQNFKQYFQAVGKSLKLALTSDLLLATEYAYSDQVRVSINFAKDGTFKDAKILLSSGSSQIDSIVLQTVNQTLKALKAPHSVGNDESTTVILKIYF